jgi:Domain of unknown function (DUF4249)
MKNIWLCFIAFLSLSSCTDIIEYDLNSSDPKVVIEGIVTDENRSFTVKITQTTDFFNPTIPPSVTGAFVEIADNAGKRDTLKETSAGIYTTQKLKTALGNTYNLTVRTGSQTFTAQSSMPSQKINLDSISRRESPNPFGAGGDTIKYTLFARFKDPKGVGNRYRLRMNVNDEYREGIDVQSDERLLPDGEIAEMPMRTQGNVKEGDRVKVDLWSMDRTGYDYFNSLASLDSGGPGGGTAAPANPNTNIKGGALGYFFAVAVASKSVVIK